MFNPDLIKENTELSLNNVAMYEFKALPEELNPEISKFIGEITLLGCEIEGPLITANLGVEKIGEKEFILMSILLPIKNTKLIPEPYKVIANFNIGKNIHYRYVGSPSVLQDIYRGLITYANQEKLNPGVIYNSYNYKELSSYSAEIKVDIYMGISNTEGR
ncbi:hypothetical protein C0Q44_06510 [Paenibacillus sp. PCH8]|uniref:hypothetical protein n=1 Tax=Paenibacillus sp. PCH8 TaxID=2066524 RepID=UPI000CF85A20|nr:hypothetical protein [Paenibacillus sp. PCH8]PQP84238.1 hypothetical protein C0Q44_06510 [Paenibacillus sp. PCH8]